MSERSNCARDHTPTHSISPAGKHMLRAIRDALDAKAVFTGTNADAGRLAGVCQEDAQRALHELSRLRFISLRRGSSR